MVERTELIINKWYSFRLKFDTFFDCKKQIPTSWTDVAEPGLFNLQSAGRSNFRYADLVELSKLLKYLKKHK